jgi:hypothetical protein
MTTLIKERKSTMKKNVNEHFITLLKTMKSSVEEFVSSVDVKIDDLTKVMRKRTINVDNLTNCVFFSNDRSCFKSNQFYSSKMFFRYFQLNQSFMFNSKLFSMFLQNMSFQNMFFSNIFSSSLNNEISRSFFNKCIYCYEENHLYKKNCVKFNENFKIERIHLQKKRIHFNVYNLEAFHVQMISYKSQQQCVKNIEKLAYSNRVVAIAKEIHIVRLNKNVSKWWMWNNQKKEEHFFEDVNSMY